ncbi:probetacellulin-like isoform X2 [Carcharodon carcharias]|uniref:probetacellulin-like isoform X2 n=1 Tax=Carcharodon carcharias TaxID=13397 RepID=UPI001B7E5441|nr:probetacellulin-like isoform X2 [Carcharodon carcharias]
MRGCRLTVLLAAGLAWFNHAAADVNSTLTLEAEKYLCEQGKQINCTGTLTESPESPQSGHFTKCPKRFRSYCIEGECRFIQSEQQPSCVCKFGYIGSRCELVDMFYLTGKQDQVIIIGLVLTMVVLIIVIIIICICVQLVDFAGNTKHEGRAAKKLKP